MCPSQRWASIEINWIRISVMGYEVKQQHTVLQLWIYFLTLECELFGKVDDFGKLDDHRMQWNLKDRFSNKLNKITIFNWLKHQTKRTIRRLTKLIKWSIFFLSRKPNDRSEVTQSHFYCILFFHSSFLRDAGIRCSASSDHSMRAERIEFNI